MCLIGLAWNIHPDYPLIVCANRDEFYARPTQSAHFWPDHPHIFAGRDLQGSGSWMGISTHGRFAAVTNIRNPASNRDDAKSRGLLVSNFLQNNQTASDYCQNLQAQSRLYNGYNFIAYDGENLIYQSNGINEPRELTPGIYGLSNATLDITWPKTQTAVKKLEQWLGSPDSVHKLARLLNDHSIVTDENLPKTGVSLEWERMLSAEFISSADYGTRCSTGFLLHSSGKAEYCEVSHDKQGEVSYQELNVFL